MHTTIEEDCLHGNNERIISEGDSVHAYFIGDDSIIFDSVDSDVVENDYTNSRTSHTNYIGGNSVCTNCIED